MQTITFILKGIAPLMMHNERLANPMDPHTVGLKPLTAQKKKTEEVLLQIAKKEWFGSMYEAKGVPVIPADNILATLKEGARKSKRGKQIESGVFSEHKYFALEYDGPTNLEKLWSDGRFSDYRGVGVQGRRVMRSRPRFDEWSARVTLVFDPELISERDLIESMTTAGLQVGLCEKRPQFGRFTVDVVEEEKREAAE